MEAGKACLTITYFNHDGKGKQADLSNVQEPGAKPQETVF